MSSKDIASFFEKGTTQQFEYCYKLYPQVLKLKADKKGGDKKALELIRLDEWYQNQLPKLIKARGKDAHMVYDELVQTMKWKQSRGKFYPQLSYLIKVNTPRAVMTETKKAFRKLPNLEQAITALSNLKGVGTTMASALLAAAAPDSAPFMADECLMAIPEIEGIDYTTKEYLNFVQHIQTTVNRLNQEAGYTGSENETAPWSPHRVELALWTHYVASDLSPELLDEMPGPGAGGGGGVTTNGSTKVLGTEEDTNDGDDDGRGETNNTATESETDNENTNPSAPITTAATTVSVGVLQDGDSNFVSNDSTSQEPNIDENTTQTTATTSTDGDVGTPLASDSESNMEAPANTKIANAIASSGVTGAAVAAPLIPTMPATATANGDNTNKIPAMAAAVGNGNGATTQMAADEGSEVDDEDVEDEEEDEEDDEDIEEEDEMSNNAVVTPLLTSAEQQQQQKTEAALTGQKRALQCGSDGGGIIEECSQPELKKIRSD